jgi:glycosyltransferase involved in cell wall biosynthesis
MPDIEFLGVEGGYDTQIRDDTVKNIKYVPNTQTIKDVYAETDILIMPSSAETWGRTATEALCSGIPVLANPTPGLKENLGDAGIFIDRNSIDEWVGTIRKLKDDRNYYKKVSEKCKQRSKELDSEPEFNTLLNKLNTYNGGSKNVLR